MKKEYQNRSGEYEKSYGGSSYNKDERSHYASRNENTAPSETKKANTKPSDAPRREVPQSQQNPPAQGKKSRSLRKNPFFIWLLLVLVSTTFTWIKNDDSWDEALQSEETMDDPWGWDDEDLEEDLQPVPADEDANDAVNAAANDVTNAATNDVLA